MDRCGIHVSRRPLDALDHATGPIACRVRLRGRHLEEGSQICAERAEILWLVDATEVLRSFERWCLERAVCALSANGIEGLAGSVASGVAPSTDEIGDAVERAHARAQAADDAVRDAEWRGRSEEIEAARVEAARARATVAFVETLERGSSPDLSPSRTAESIARAFAWLAASSSPSRRFGDAFEAARITARDRIDTELERRLLDCDEARAWVAAQRERGRVESEAGAETPSLLFPSAGRVRSAADRISALFRRLPMLPGSEGSGPPGARGPEVASDGAAPSSADVPVATLLSCVRDVLVRHPWVRFATWEPDPERLVRIGLPVRDDQKGLGALREGLERELAPYDVELDLRTIGTDERPEALLESGIPFHVRATEPSLRVMERIPGAARLAAAPHREWARCPRCELGLDPHWDADLERELCPFCGHCGLVWERRPPTAVEVSRHVSDNREAARALAPPGRDASAAPPWSPIRPDEPLTAVCTACHAVLEGWRPEEGIVCLFCGRAGTLDVFWGEP